MINRVNPLPVNILLLNLKKKELIKENEINKVKKVNQNGNRIPP